MNKNGIFKKNRLYTILSYLLLLLFCFYLYSCGRAEDFDYIQEEKIVAEAYDFFIEYYFDPCKVRPPQKGETLKEYVDSYRSANDIYTMYLEKSEARDLSDDLNSSEYLIDEIPEGYGNILYLAFDKFTENTAENVRNKTENFIASRSQQNPESLTLILDLRINRGGRASEAAATLDYFVSSADNETILSEIQHPSRIGDEDYLKVFKAGDFYSSFTKEKIFDKSNMYVLTSGLTASASEVLVAGLVHFNEATQVGSTTFGKNRVVNYFYHERGDGFIMTTGIVYHADGLDREGEGITPESYYYTEDPVGLLNNLLGAAMEDTLREDWGLSSRTLANLYDKDYWRKLHEEFAISIIALNGLWIDQLFLFK